MKNKIMLITYADSFGKNLKEVKTVLDRYFKREIGSVHILPFYPSSGDRGFAPINYRLVSPEFGTWEDVKALADDYELMFDFMINHLSRRSPEFLDFVEKHEESPYADMFLRFCKFWPGGEPTQEQVDLLNKRKPCAPCEEIEFADHTVEKIWCTFDNEQMDLDLDSEVTWRYIEETLDFLIEKGAAMIRLDAFAFATKKLNTSCFFLEPEIWDMMDRVQKILDRHSIPMLPEIHDQVAVQMKIADHGYKVYDFVLPVMVLHTLYSGNAAALKNWLAVCPKDQSTTLDTHDGLGTVDVEGLLTEDEVQAVVDRTEAYGANFKFDYSANGSNVVGAVGDADAEGVGAVGAAKQRVYQINCSYYSAVGEDDDAYLLSRAIQFFTPGIPQVYYMGLLAGENDYELMERTNYSRNISRHDYTLEEVEEMVKKPVVQKLCALMRFRNDYPVFDGTMSVSLTPDHILEITWEDHADGKEGSKLCAVLHADIRQQTFEIKYLDETGGYRTLDLNA